MALYESHVLLMENYSPVVYSSRQFFLDKHLSFLNIYGITSKFSSKFAKRLSSNDLIKRCNWHISLLLPSYSQNSMKLLAHVCLSYIRGQIVFMTYSIFAIISLHSRNSYPSEKKNLNYKHFFGSFIEFWECDWSSNETCQLYNV